MRETADVRAIRQVGSHKHLLHDNQACFVTNLNVESTSRRAQRRWVKLKLLVLPTTDAIHELTKHLADTNATLLQAAGVGQSEYKGTMYWNRTSFVIDPNGRLRKERSGLHNRAVGRVFYKWGPELNR